VRNAVYLFFILMVVGMSLLGQQKEKFTAQVFERDSSKLLYRIYSPKDLDETKKYPLILTFHGSSCNGSDNISQLREDRGPMELLSYLERKGVKAFIISPQCPSGQMWVNTPWYGESHTMPKEPSESMSLTLNLLDQLLGKLPVDTSRLYVTGISIGGFGTWDIIQRRPQFFAGAIPVCGGGDVAEAKHLVKLPIWVFHGDSDTVVLSKRSRDMVQALKAAGGKPKYTEYVNTEHDAFTETYKNDQVWDWLFEQSRSN
jgi:predicted peptidase